MGNTIEWADALEKRDTYGRKTEICEFGAGGKWGQPFMGKWGQPFIVDICAFGRSLVTGHWSLVIGHWWAEGER